MKKTVSVLLSAVITASLFSFATFADGESERIDLENTDLSEIEWTYNSEVSYFEAKINGSTVYMLRQEDIVDNKLPSEGSFYIMEDLTISKGVTTTGPLTLTFLDHTINYTSADRSEYMIDASYFSGTYGLWDGVIKSTNGAPIFRAQADYTSLNFYYMELIGCGDNNTDNDASMFSFWNRTNLYFGQSVAHDCSAMNGGVVALKDKHATMTMSCGKIHDCYALNGGAIYCEGQVDFSKGIFSDTNMIYNNTATDKGGAICIMDQGRVKVNYMTEITENVSPLGGAIYMNKINPNYYYEEGLQIKTTSNVNITGNTNASGKENNVYLDCVRYNPALSEQRTLFNIIVLQDKSDSTVKIGVSYNKDCVPTSLMEYDKRSYDNVICENVIYDEDGYVVVREADGSYKESLIEDVIAVKGYKLTLKEGKIGIKIYVYAPEEVRSKVGFAYSMNKFGITSELGGLSLGYQQDPDYPDYICYYVETDSAYMTEPINFTLLYDQRLVCNKSITVADYGRAIVRNSSRYDSKVYNLVNSMLQYGGAAQEYFDINVEDPAYTYKETIYVSESAMKSAFADYQPQVVTPGEHFSYYGASLSLMESPYLNMYIKCTSDVTNENIKATINGNTVSATKKGNYIILKIRDIGIQNLDNVYSIKVSYVDGSGETEELSFDYSICNYLYLHFNNHYDDNEKLTRLLWLMYSYYRNAKQYAG